MSDKPKKYSNLIDTEDIEKLKEYLKALDKDVANIVNYLDRFPRLFEQSTEPTIQRNTQAVWRDSDDGKIYFLANISGNQKKVELT